MIKFLLFILLIHNLSILAKQQEDEIDRREALSFLIDKRVFANAIENQREDVSFLDKRRRLARTKFEEHCKPKGKIHERICPSVEQCLLPSIDNKKVERQLRAMLEDRNDANQFLFNRKRFLFFSASTSNDDDYKEQHVRERRRKGFSLYEHYCESTDRLPRACPQIDRCACGDCDQK